MNDGDYESMRQYDFARNWRKKISPMLEALVPTRPTTNVRQTHCFTFRNFRGNILLVGNFFLWPLCELPDFLPTRDDGPNPSRQSASCCARSAAGGLSG